MSDDVPIRPLTPADAPAYRTLRLEGLRSHPEAFGASYEDELASSSEMLAKRVDGGPTNRVFGAFAGADLIGTAGFFVPNQSAKQGHKGLLVGVHVAPAHRGRGLARRLVETVIAHANGHVVLLQAAVGVDNAPARQLYDKLGFRPYGLEEKALLVDGRYVDEVLLVLDYTSERSP